MKTRKCPQLGRRRIFPFLLSWLFVLTASDAQALAPPPQDRVLRFSNSSGAYGVGIHPGANFTMEAWVYLDGPSPGLLIMGKAVNPPGDPYLHYALGLEDNGLKPRFAYSNGQPGSYRNIFGQSDLPVRVWMHLAAVMDGGATQLFVNGVLVASGTSNGSTAGASVPFSLGGPIADINASPCGCTYSGAMREARMWSRALTPDEIKTYAGRKLTGTEPGLMANWRLAEASGQTAAAIGPQATPLALRGAALFTSTQLLENEPYWEIRNLPELSGLSPGSWKVVYKQANGRPGILIASSPYSLEQPLTGPVGVYHNEGNRVFTPSLLNPPVGMVWPRNSTVGDFDRDGFEDVLIADSGLDAPPWPGGITRIFMQRSGKMVDETSLRLAPGPATTHDICSGDVNADGSPDLLFSETNVGPKIGPHLYLNNGAGRFTLSNHLLPPVFGSNSPPSFLSCQFADVNRDGAVDLLLGSWGGGPHGPDWLLRNDGRGNLVDVSATSMPVKRGGADWGTLGFAVADVNRDGWPDLIATISTDSTSTLMQLLINNRDGTFRDGPDAALNVFRDGWFDKAYAADLNLDGWPDLVANRWTPNGFRALLFQNMGGHFEERPGFIGYGAPADFDGDGCMDIVFHDVTYHMAWGKNLWPGVAVATPVVTSAITAGGNPGIAQNGWIEIRGTNLAPLNVPAGGMDWSAARSFAAGEMPTELGGVSVTINGKAAFIYYVSPTQVNVLAPLDGTLGAVDLVLTSGGRASAPFSANMTAVAPSFPLVGANYIVATHANYSLVGPTSLSSPGYPFTPARPGETILMFAFGFGLPTTTLVNGSSSQAGPLPALPVIQIGGLAATVTYAGVISPGLYQLNVVVPGNAADGDNSVSVTYAGAAAPAGLKIAVQR